MKVKQNSHRDRERNGGPPYKTVILLSNDGSEELGEYIYSGFTEQELATYRILKEDHGDHLPREVSVDDVDTTDLGGNAAYFIEWAKPQLIFVDAKIGCSLSKMPNVVVSMGKKETIRKIVKAHKASLKELFRSCKQLNVVDCGLIVTEDERCLLCDYDNTKGGNLTKLEFFVDDPDGIVVQSDSSSFSIPMPKPQFKMSKKPNVNPMLKNVLAKKLPQLSQINESDDEDTNPEEEQKQLDDI